jgi:DNA-binding XRE family transcriptional regulator
LERVAELGLPSPEEDPNARYRVPAFTLSASELPSITGWTKTYNWTAVDDSALLIGIYRHGIGEWEKIYNDESIDLSVKIAPAVRPETAPPGAMPKGSHLETRSLGILRQLEKSRLHPGLKRKRQDSRKEKTKQATMEKFTSQLGDVVNTAVRKLRTLQRKGKEMETSVVLRKIRKYIEIIGKRIDEEGNTAKQKLKLWNHVWDQSGLAEDGFALHQMYLRLVDESKGQC